jgi:hypothetical protein
MFSLQSSFFRLKDVRLSISCLYLFAQHSLCGVGIMHAICAVNKDVDVVLLSVLLSLVVGSSMLPE